jgi:proteasome lid subunit RPN8/RPN11
VRDDSTTREIYAHAAAAYPEECCGIVAANGSVVRLQNISPDPCNGFSVSPEDFIKYSGGALFMYHSHPGRLAVASDADIACQARMRLPLMIVSWPKGDIRMIGDPCEGKPLEGRQFIYGVYDCYSLVRDFYAREYAMVLPTVTRPRFGWWEREGMDPFTEELASAPLVEVDTPEQGDMLLIRIAGAKSINHAGVCMGDGSILHHKLLSLSCRSEYDSSLRNATTRILRRAD